MYIFLYLGEVYPPWRWFEKCDRTKAIEQKLANEHKVPDFYNITLTIVYYMVFFSYLMI